MGMSKAIVANPNQYPQIPSGYYSTAFKKDERERNELKSAKKLHKKLIAQDYGKDYTPEQLKKINNPRSTTLN